MVFEGHDSCPDGLLNFIVNEKAIKLACQNWVLLMCGIPHHIKSSKNTSGMQQYEHIGSVFLESV